MDVINKEYLLFTDKVIYKESNHFQFYNNLINHNDIHDTNCLFHFLVRPSSKSNEALAFELSINETLISY